MWLRKTAKRLDRTSCEPNAMASRSHSILMMYTKEARARAAPCTSAPSLGLDWAATWTIDLMTTSAAAPGLLPPAQPRTFHQQLPNQNSHSAHHITPPHPGAAFVSSKTHTLAESSSTVIFTALTLCDTLNKTLRLLRKVKWMKNSLPGRYLTRSSGKQ